MVCHKLGELVITSAPCIANHLQCNARIGRLTFRPRHADRKELHATATYTSTIRLQRRLEKTILISSQPVKMVDAMQCSNTALTCAMFIALPTKRRSCDSVKQAFSPAALEDARPRLVLMSVPESVPCCSSAGKGHRSRIAAGTVVAIGCGKPCMSQCTERGMPASSTRFHNLLLVSNVGAISV